MLEWAEVGAYAVALIAAVGVAHRTGGLVRVAYAGVALAAFVAIGEEISCGQRLLDFTTPETLAASNRQKELNLHNVAGAESSTRLLLLGAACYGVVAPLVLRRGPFPPPAMARSRLRSRGRVLRHQVRVPSARPTYAQAKFSEWPEFCFAGAVALAACEMLRRTRHQKLRGRTR